MDKFNDLNYQKQRLMKLIENFSFEDKDKILQALELSRKAHAGQKRDEGPDFIIHPIRIACSLIEELKINDVDIICAGLLHDVVEDSDVTVAQIKNQFDEKVADWVENLTRPREMTKKEKFKYLIKASENVRLVKAVDALDNFRSMPYRNDRKSDRFQRYLREMYELRMSIARSVSRYLADEMQKIASKLPIPRPDSKQPIPDHARRVFKGVIFDVYQWGQEMFDGSKATFEKIKRLDTVLVIPVTVDKKIILLQEQQPGVKAMIGLPGGRIDEGEKVLEVARRELLEETGCEADEIFLWKAVQPVSKLDWVVYNFVAKNCRQVSDDLTLDAGEKISILKVTFDEFVNEIVVSDDFRDFDVAFEILKLKQDEKKLVELRELFLG